MKLAVACRVRFGLIIVLLFQEISEGWPFLLPTALQWSNNRPQQAQLANKGSQLQPCGQAKKASSKPAQIQISLQISANCGGHCPNQQKQAQAQSHTKCAGHCTVPQTAAKRGRTYISGHPAQQIHLKPQLHLKPHPILVPAYASQQAYPHAYAHVSPHPLPHPKPGSFHMSTHCGKHCSSHNTQPKPQHYSKPQPVPHLHLHQKPMSVHASGRTHHKQPRPNPAMHIHLHPKSAIVHIPKPRLVPHLHPHPQPVSVQVPGHSIRHHLKPHPNSHHPSQSNSNPKPYQLSHSHSHPKPCPNLQPKAAHRPASNKAPCLFQNPGGTPACSIQRPPNSPCLTRCPNSSGHQRTKQTIQQHIVHKETHIKQKVTHTIESV